MDEVLQLLKAAGVFYLATTESGQPRVRPFGFVMVYEGRLCFTTNNKKPVYRQLTADPRLEMSGMVSENEWIRLSGKAVFDGGMAEKKKAFELYPGFAGLYGTPENPDFEVFSLAEGEAQVCTYGNRVVRTITL